MLPLTHPHPHPQFPCKNSVLCKYFHFSKEDIIFSRPIYYLVWFASQASTQISKLASFSMLMFKQIPTRCYVCSNSFILFLSWMVVNNTHRSLQWISNSDGTFLIAISNSDALKSTRKNYVAQVTSACLCSACSVVFFYQTPQPKSSTQTSFLCGLLLFILDLWPPNYCLPEICLSEQQAQASHSTVLTANPKHSGGVPGSFKDLPAVPTLPTVCAYSEVFLFTVF